ncbi:MAG: cytidylate kinase family protein [Blautia sp.]
MIHCDLSYHRRGENANAGRDGFSHQSSSGSDRIRRNEDWWDKPEYGGREGCGRADGRSDGESFLFAVEVLTAQHNIIKKIAGQGNCVIVGRGADVLLANRKDMIPAVADFANQWFKQ